MTPRVINEKTSYPNMMPMEIIKSGVALSGDALEKFMVECVEHQHENNSEAVEEIKASIDRAISDLEDIRDDL